MSAVCGIGHGIVIKGTYWNTMQSLSLSNEASRRPCTASTGSIDSPLRTRSDSAVWMLDPAQRQADHGTVVHIRIKLVVELKYQPPGSPFGFLIFQSPGLRTCFRIQSAHF